MPTVRTSILGLSLLGACATARPAVQDDSDLPDIPRGPRPGVSALFLVKPAPELNDDDADESGTPPRDALVPLVCHDGERLLTGRTCLGLLPPGRQVKVPVGGKPAAARRRMVPCDLDDSETPGLVLTSGRAGGSTFTVWPKKAASRVFPVQPAWTKKRPSCRGWCTFGRTGHRRIKLAPRLRQRLASAASAAGMRQRAREIELVQEVVIDIDGDGAAERIFSVVVPDRDAEDYSFLFSALFVARGDPPGELSLLRRQDSDAMVVRGGMDLDGDGVRELWLHLVPTAGAGHTHLVVTGAAGGGVIGSYSCRGEAD